MNFTIFESDTIPKANIERRSAQITAHWYVDGLHQIHEDYRGQTGSVVTFGKQTIASSSNNMKCNIKSSTETELVLLADKLTNIILMQYFIE